MYDLNIVSVNDSLASLDDVETSVRKECDMYDGLVVTDASVKDDKKLLAQIRKRRTELDDQRKKLKAKFEEPVKRFDNRVREIIGIYDVTIRQIDDQVKEVEQLRIIKKRDRIKEIFDSVVPAKIDGWLTLDDVYKKTWENATTSEKTIRDDIETAYSNLSSAYLTIKSLGNEWETDGLEELRRTRDLGKAVAKMEELRKLAATIKAKEKTVADPVYDFGFDEIIETRHYTVVKGFMDDDQIKQIRQIVPDAKVEVD